jgi:hypothetical protein
MNDLTGNDAGSPPSPERRRLLAGAAATGGALLLSGRARAVPRPQTVSPADPALQAVLEKYGGEFGRIGARDAGGPDGDF